MRNFLKITVSIVAIFVSAVPLRADKPVNVNFYMMYKPVVSILESEAVKVSLNSDDETKFTLYISDGTLYIKYSKPQELVNGEVIVYNLLGKEIVRKKLENTNVNEVSVPVQNTCYIVRLNYGGKVYTKKVIPSSN